MRKEKLVVDEIQAAEKAKSDRESGRRDGFSMMKVRDLGWNWFSNGALIEWNTARPLGDGEARTCVPKGSFILTIDGKKTLFDAEEFRKSLRWV